MSPLESAKKHISIPDAWTLLGLPGKAEKNCRSPFRRDRKPSFSVFSNGRRYKDHTTGESGDVVDFISHATSTSKSETSKQLIQWAKGSTGMSETTVSLRPEEALKTPRKPIIPVLLPPETHELELIKQQRQLHDIDGLCIAEERGLLKIGNVYDQGECRRCWIVTDGTGRNAQARRLDGEPFGNGNNTFKAKTLRGCSTSWPIGTANLGDAQNIILTEGPPDMLAAISIGRYIRDGVIGDLGFACITGAGVKIDAEALTYYKGRNVRIVIHADDAGESACSSWWEQFKEAGATVDAFEVEGMLKGDGSPANDLNDVAFLSIETGETEPKYQDPLPDLFRFYGKEGPK